MNELIKYRPIVVATAIAPALGIIIFSPIIVHKTQVSLYSAYHTMNINKENGCNMLNYFSPKLMTEAGDALF